MVKRNFIFAVILSICLEFGLGCNYNVPCGGQIPQNRQYPQNPQYNHNPQYNQNPQYPPNPQYYPYSAYPPHLIYPQYPQYYQYPQYSPYVMPAAPPPPAPTYYAIAEPKKPVKPHGHSILTPCNPVSNIISLGDFSCNAVCKVANTASIGKCERYSGGFFCSCD